MRRLVYTVVIIGFAALVQPATAEPRLALSTVKDCDVCPEMVVIPAGSFRMGSIEATRGNAQSVHSVSIHQPFAVGKFEVAFREWDACASDGGCGGHQPSDERWGRDNRPVINFSWDDAQKYLAWLFEGLAPIAPVHAGDRYHRCVTSKDEIAFSEDDFVKRLSRLATYEQGVQYYVGDGVPQDFAEAAKWLRKAAEEGFDFAQFMLGAMLENGEGVRQDYVEAAEWHRKAAEQGLPMAQLNLGTLYAKGEGVPQDFVRAHMWFNVAAARGDEALPIFRNLNPEFDWVMVPELARNYRETVAEMMTSEDVSGAQKLAQKWLEKCSH